MPSDVSWMWNLNGFTLCRMERGRNIERLRIWDWRILILATFLQLWRGGVSKPRLNVRPAWVMLWHSHRNRNADARNFKHSDDIKMIGMGIWPFPSPLLEGLRTVWTSSSPSSLQASCKTSSVRIFLVPYTFWNNSEGSAACVLVFCDYLVCHIIITSSCPCQAKWRQAGSRYKSGSYHHGWMKAWTLVLLWLRGCWCSFQKCLRFFLSDADDSDSMDSIFSLLLILPNFA